MKPWPQLLQACTLFEVAVRVLALHNQIHQQLQAGSEANHTIQHRGETFRQKMYNFQDLQYSVDLMVGGQNIRGILDTGSFELLVFPHSCHTCGSAKAKSYNPNSSATFVQGKRNRLHTYGSGSCTAVDAHERIEVGPLVAKHQAFWDATQCQMPMLNKASFNAVVGIGPPGEPEVIARNGLMRVKSLENRAKELGKKIPTHIRHLKKTYTEDLADAPHKVAMLENMGVTTFSVCLEREPDSPGWLIWNDNNPEPSSAFTQIDVVGEVTWGVKLTGIGLHGGTTNSNTILGCQHGCGAIVDTGTSLLAVPSDVYERVYNSVQDMGLDCDDISKYPDLVMHVGSKRLRFPPDAYMGALVGEPSNEVKKYLRLSSLDRPTKCELLLMDLGNEKTQFGPMTILGMPFFREYYTTFDIGKGPGSRSISIAPADSQCYPAAHSDLELDSEHETIYAFRKNRRPQKVRQIDASTLRLPRWPNWHGSSGIIPPIM